jgi:hypothetical protein
MGSVTTLDFLTVRDVDAFWRKVDQTSETSSCWPWVGSRDMGGYGIFHRARKGEPRIAMRAHRLAFVLTSGAIPVDRPMILHGCDNPPCCNPGHLHPGTAGDNSREMVERGRHWTRLRPENIPRGRRNPWEVQPRGEGHGNAKLTEQQVRDIRKRYPSPGNTQRSLAAEFGVSQGEIWQIVTRRHWSHV